MIRTASLDLQDGEITVKYMVELGTICWVSVLSKVIEYPADWVLDVPEAREALEAHHANLLLEENCNES